MNNSAALTWFGSLLLGLLSASATAQLALLPSEFADHPLLEGFPDSQIIEARFSENINHTLVLGSLQRTRQQVVPEASERVRGNVTRLLYEVSQEFTGDDVHEFYREQMREKSYSELYSCEGRACGSSNYWANDIFRNRILYGPERNQYYLAMRTNLGVASEPSMSVYIITRANRRIYAYVEVIETGGELPPLNVIAPDAVLSLLQRDGGVILPGILFDADDRLDPGSDIDYLVQILQSDSELAVYLVGHLHGSDSLAVLTRRSLQRAAALKQELVDRGISESRIEAEGVGPLAPICATGDCSERIEMVLR